MRAATRTYRITDQRVLFAHPLTSISILNSFSLAARATLTPRSRRCKGLNTHLGGFPAPPAPSPFLKHGTPSHTHPAGATSQRPPPGRDGAALLSRPSRGDPRPRGPECREELKRCKRSRRASSTSRQAPRAGRSPAPPASRPRRAPTPRRGACGGGGGGGGGGDELTVCR